MTVEDQLAVSILERIRNAVARCPVRADGTVNQRDFYDTLGDEMRSLGVDPDEQKEIS